MVWFRTAGRLRRKRVRSSRRDASARDLNEARSSHTKMIHALPKMNARGTLGLMRMLQQYSSSTCHVGSTTQTAAGVQRSRSNVALGQFTAASFGTVSGSDRKSELKGTLFRSGLQRGMVLRRRPTPRSSATHRPSSWSTATLHRRFEGSWGGLLPLPRSARWLARAVAWRSVGWQHGTSRSLRRNPVGCSGVHRPSKSRSRSVGTDRRFQTGHVRNGPTTQIASRISELSRAMVRPYPKQRRKRPTRRSSLRQTETVKVVALRQATSSSTRHSLGLRSAKVSTIASSSQRLGSQHEGKQVLTRCSQILLLSRRCATVCASSWIARCSIQQSSNSSSRIENGLAQRRSESSRVTGASLNSGAAVSRVHPRQNVRPREHPRKHSRKHSNPTVRSGA